MSYAFHSRVYSGGGDETEAMFAGKNAIISVSASKRQGRRHSQFERAVHRFYTEPPFLQKYPLFVRFYWALRSLQYHIFYENAELDDEDLSDLKWEVAIKPPPIEQLSRTTGFDKKWIKYMYSKFKTECPTGRMHEPEFKRLLSCIIAPERSSDQYLTRLFHAFAATNDSTTVTFQSLLDCLAFLCPHTPEVNAGWTIKIITGREDTQFNFSEFLQFAKSVFALQEGKSSLVDECNTRETVYQRAAAIFHELDQNRDGIVQKEDMVRFFQTTEIFR